MEAVFGKGLIELVLIAAIGGLGFLLVRQRQLTQAARREADEAAGLLARARAEHAQALAAQQVSLQRALGEKAQLQAQETALRAQLAELARSDDERQLAELVFDKASEGILVTDAANDILRVNPAFTAITGYSAEEVIGRNPRLLKSGRHDAAFYQTLWQSLLSQGHWEGEIWNRYKNGDLHAEWLSITRIDLGDGRIFHLGIFHDITRRLEDVEQLRFRAHHDPLTELPNRTLFLDRLRLAINQARRYQRRFALLMIDLDRFKEVNDRLGHLAGDQLLVEAARRLASCVRETDTVARLGGDEFAIILAETASDEEAELIAARVVGLLNEPYHLDAGTAQISGCVGIALYPLHGSDLDTLLSNADHALYAAKTGGRNQYRIYLPRVVDIEKQPALI